MKKNIMDFINKCETYKVSIKNLHWSAENMSEHKLCDEIANSISDYEDKVAEVAQGIYGKISKNELKPKLAKITTTKKMLQDLLGDVNILYKTLQDKKEIGIKSILEEYIGVIDQFIYLTTLCIKEDFKRKVTNKLQEEKIRKCINESIKKVLKEEDFNSMIHNKKHETYRLKNGNVVEINLEEPTLTVYKNNKITSEITKQEALNKIEYLINLWNKNGGRFEDTLEKIFK